MAIRTLIGVTTQGRAPRPVEPVSAVSQSVAVLAGGPSLRELWPLHEPDGYDVVIAVNGAALAFPCDYAVAVDRKLVERLIAETKPRRALVTYDTYERACRKRGLGFRRIPVRKGLKSYTFPRALLLAAQEAGEAGLIDVFGMDYSTDRLDAGGVTGDRGALRWREEAEALRVVWPKAMRSVHGRINPERRAFICGASSQWPG